jgi:hypothetical protein
MCGDAYAQDNGRMSNGLRGLGDREHRRSATPDLRIGDIEPMLNLGVVRFLTLALPSPA